VFDSRLLIALLAAALAAPGCTPRRALELHPPQTVPGESAVLRIAQGKRLEPGPVEVRVGGRSALLLEDGGMLGQQFLVPDLPPGPARVSLLRQGREIAQGEIRIQPYPAEQLVFTMSEQGVEPIARRGVSSLSRPDRSPPAVKGLAYEVLRADGYLLASGVLPHPRLDRQEMHGPDGDLRNVRPPAQTSFQLRVPAAAGRLTVRFFEVDAGVDLDISAGRAARRFLQEVQIEGVRP
jgi:hypothetical protein